MVQGPLTQFRTVRLHTVELMRDLSQAQLDYVPEPGEWSIAEVVDHLILVEQAFRGDIAILIERARAGQTPYLYRSFAAFNARPAFLPEFLLPWIETPLYCLTIFTPPEVRDYLIRHVPIRALAPDITLPRPGRARAILVTELHAMLSETESLFAANPGLDYEAMRHQHPLFGIQTVPQLLRFVSVHEQAHHDQISRVLASPQFPREVRV